MMAKRSTFFLVYICLSCYAFAQNKYAFLLQKPYEQRCYLLDSLIYPVTNSYDTGHLLKKIQEVSMLAKQEGDEELFLEMEYSRLRFTTDLKVWFKNSSNRQYLQSLVEQAKSKGYAQLQVQFIELYAKGYSNAEKDIGASIEQYLNALYLMRQIPTDHFPDKADYVYNDLGGIYYGLEDYDNAKQVLLEARTLPFYPAPLLAKSRVIININNTLGLIYRVTAKYDSAQFFFKKAYSVALATKDSVWIGIAGGNIGITYFLQERYHQAVPLLENDVRLSLLWKEYGNAANSLLKLAEINLRQQKIPVARQQIIQAGKLITPQTTDYYPHLSSFYLLMARLNDKEGNVAMAYRYADSALLMKDTVFQQKSAVALAKAQQKTNIEHHKLEVQALEHQQKIQLLIRNSLLVALVLLVIITLLLISRQRLLKKEKQFAEARRQLAQQQLADARNQLQSFTSNIREKNELIERLTLEMVSLQTSLNEESIDYRRDTLNHLRQQTILTEEEWEAFKRSFEKVYPNWFEGIRKKLPGLSAADLRFMALTKLKLNAREMASVLGISPGSIRMSRHRIRKKYNLTEEESLELLAEEV